MKPLEECEFTIVGAGLMGCSLALSLRHHVRAIRGVDPNPENRAAAGRFSIGTFVELHESLSGPAADADVIVLAAPIRAILTILSQISTGAIRLRPGALVIDLGSAKADIVTAMDALPADLQAVGGHPMCGKETSGPGAADAELYRGCTFALSPAARTTPETLAFAERMIRALGATPLVMAAAAHDAAVAQISHLPYLVSAALVGATLANPPDAQTDGADSPDARWLLASSGFRDTSRLAGSDVTMMGDTVNTNRAAVLAALSDFRDEINHLYELLENANDPEFRATLDRVRRVRIAWYAFYARTSGRASS